MDDVHLSMKYTRFGKARTYLSSGDIAGTRRLAEAQEREVQALQSAADQIEREINRLSSDNDVCMK